MIQYASMSTNDIKLSGASLFQSGWYHDVHSSVNKYLKLALYLFRK